MEVEYCTGKSNELCIQVLGKTGKYLEAMTFHLADSLDTEWKHHIQVTTRLTVCVQVLQFYKELIKIGISSTNSAAPISMQNLLMTSSLD